VRTRAIVEQAFRCELLLHTFFDVIAHRHYIADLLVQTVVHLLSTVYLLYTGTVATMYFRNKAATDAAAVTADLTSGITNTASLDLHGVELQERESLIDRDATPTRPKAHVQSLHGRDQGNVNVGVAHASPEKFAFFPTLSRSSSSELTRNRKNRATNGTVSSGIRTSNSNTVMSELIRDNNNSPDGRSRSILNTNIDSMYIIASPNSPTFNTTNTTTVNAITDSGSNSPYLSDTDIESSGLIDDVEGIGGTEPNSDNTTHNMVSLVVNCIYVPVEHVIRALMPALHPQIPHFISGNHHQQHLHQQRVLSTHRVSLLRAVIVLASCITAIGVLAVCIVLFCESVINRLGFDSATMGATLVALGAEVRVIFEDAVVFSKYSSNACTFTLPTRPLLRSSVLFCLLFSPM